MTISIRDLLSWVNFINVVVNSRDLCQATHNIAIASSYVHGACLVFLDALGSGASSSVGAETCQSSRDLALHYLVQQLTELFGQDVSKRLHGMTSSAGDRERQDVILTETSFGIEPFYIKKGL